MRNIVYRVFLILIFLLLTLQVLDWIAIADVKPDILLILTIFIAQKQGMMTGQISGFFAGLAEDIFSIQLFGIHSFCKLVIGYFSGLLYSNFVLDNFLIQALLGFVGSLLHGFLFLGAKALFDSIDVGYYFLNVFWIKVLYTTLLTPILFFILGFFEKRFGES